jgi:HAD superfamily hydrolase (TIGR01450 family)
VNTALPDFDSFAAILLDLDGTIYHEDHALPGAVELIRRLINEKRKFACLTNSTWSPRQLTARLARMGVPIEPDRIYTAAAAAADFVLQHFAGDQQPRVCNVATEGFEELLDGKVIWVTQETEPCDVVVCATMTSIFATEQRLRLALTLLRRSAHPPAQTMLLGMCADRVYPSPRGIEFGSGAMTALLSYASAVEPVFTGKPEAVFFQELCQRMGVEPRRCLLIGDNAESDIRGAKRLGMRTLLTLTGVTRAEDLAGLPPDQRPEDVVGDLTELV